MKSKLLFVVAVFCAIIATTAFGSAHAQYVIAVPTPAGVRPLEYIEPEYPQSEWEAGRHGFLTATGNVQTDGTITDVAITETSGSPVLDENAQTALRQWRFNPVEAPVAYSVRFEFRRDTLETLNQKTCAHLVADVAWFRQRNPETPITEMPLKDLTVGIFMVVLMERGPIQVDRLQRVLGAYEQTVAYCETHPDENYLRRFRRFAGL